MAYADRTATTGAPLAVTFTKLLDLPALPENQHGWDTPQFLSGHSIFSSGPDFTSSNKPTLWATSYDELGDNVFTGNLVMGLAHADYALRETGTGASSGFSEHFEKEGLIDGMYVGLNYTLAPVDGYYSPDVSLEFQRQTVGDFTGGVAGVVAANATETQTVSFNDYLGTAGISYIGAGLASTTIAPSALFIVHPGYDDGPDGPTVEAVDQVGAYRITSAGSVGLVSLFRTDIAAHPTQGGIFPILAQCRDTSRHYFVRAGNAASTSFTSCRESAWGTYVYNNYTPKFSDPDLPATLGTLVEGDSTYQLLAIYGTDVGFLISYLKYDGALWNPLFVLVDKGWTTVQHVTPTAGDATAIAILAQAVRDPLSPPAESMDFGGNAISMMMEGGYAWLLGGTPSAPLVVEGHSGVPLPDDTVNGNEDDSVVVRSWGYKLDGHTQIVWRLGPNKTLVFDRQSRTWSEYASPDQTKWRAHVGQNWLGMGAATFVNNFGSDVVAGDDATGVLWVLDPTAGQDDDPDTGTPTPFLRVVIGGIQATGRDTIACNAVQMDMALGSPAFVGATVTLETSDDFGHTWVNRGANTIQAGSFNQICEWRSLGTISAPGRIFRFSDDGATVRVDGADLR